MRAVFCALVLAIGLLAVPLVPAVSAGHKVCTTKKVSTTLNGKVYTSYQQDCYIVSDGATTPTRDSSLVSKVACDPQTVAVEKHATGQSTDLKICGARGSVEQGTKNINWAVIMLRAFRSTAIPESELVIQPPGGKTLINFETLYRTKAKPFTRSMRLLGTRVQLRISPSSYTWVTGAGEQFSTTDPGVVYDESRPMSDYVSYVYEHPAEELTPRVDVTWSAQFRVGNGKWRPVQGTVTTTGPESDLKVVEARTVLLGGYN